MIARDRRALRLGLGLVVAAVIVTRVLPALWQGWRRSQEELQAQRDLLARAEGAIASLDSVEARAAATRTALVALAPKLLTGGTEAEAFADLNARVTVAAGHQRTRVLRADQVADSTREGRLHRVSVLVQVESDWSGLTGFLHATVADPAVLRVRTVTVHGAEVPVTGPGAEALTGEVEISGWYLVGGATRPRGKEGE